MQPRILVTIFALSLSLSPTVLFAQQEQLPQGHEAHHPESAVSTDEPAASDQTGTEAANDEQTEAKDLTWYSPLHGRKGRSRMVSRNRWSGIDRNVGRE